jgi:hypothetical protein
LASPVAKNFSVDTLVMNQGDWIFPSV